MTEQVIKKLKGAGYTLATSDLVTKCKCLVDRLGLGAGEFADEFEGFALTRGMTSGLVSEGDLDAFSSSWNQKKRKRVKAEPENLTWAGSGWNDIADKSVLSDASNTGRSHLTPPKAAAKVEVPVPSSISTSETSVFQRRTQKGQIVTSLNGHLPFDDNFQASDSLQSCIVLQRENGSATCNHYMVDRLQDKANYLDGRIRDFAAAFEDATGCHPSHPVYAACQEPVLMVGRICCDSEGRLNERSVLLEGSVELSNGMHTKLDLSKLDSFKLFPGQVVVVKGSNPAGACIVAHELCTSIPSPMPQSSLNQLQQHAGAKGEQGLSILVAAGPFTSKDDVLYEPLQAVLDHCNERPPHVLLLLGPFVDAEHPLLQAGTIQDSFDDVFATQVVEKIDRFLDSAGAHSQVVLVPSIRDLHHHAVFPQPPLPLESLRSRHLQAYTCLPNPAIFSCNEVTVGVVTSDVVKHLSGQEVQRGPLGDRLPNLAGHLLGQQSFYPMFPPAAGALLDSSLANKLHLPVTPDILVLPSDLNPFAKLLPLPSAPPHEADPVLQSKPTPAGPNAGQVVCVNPGRLTKGNGGGTFSCFQIGASEEGKAATLGSAPATNGKLPHHVHKRCKVTLKRV